MVERWAGEEVVGWWTGGLGGGKDSVSLMFIILSLLPPQADL